MKQISLAQLCRKYGLSRRTIQNYEKEGLVKASGKTLRGYLLYDEETVSRILLIRFFQVIGYQVKEIGRFIDGTSKLLKKKIEDKVPELKNRLDRTSMLLLETEQAVKLLAEGDEKEFMKLISRKEKEK